MSTVEKHAIWAVIAGARAAELAACREPFLIAELRLPAAPWPRAIPVDGRPEDNAHTPQANAKWLQALDHPRHLISATPKAFPKAPWVQSPQDEISGLAVADMGSRLYHIPETAPDRISAAQAWLT